MTAKLLTSQGVQT